jgi:TetR/AcrR family transcriptional repressor of mexJK operon
MVVLRQERTERFSSPLAKRADQRHSKGMAVPEDSESPKRRAILSAATDLFAARGYGAVSMDAIAREADVSKATLYAHFESKDRLFATIIQVACHENINIPDAPGDEPSEPEGEIETALKAVGGRILRFFLEERTLAIHRLVVAETVRFPELGRVFYENGPVAGREMLAAWMSRRAALVVPEPRAAAEQFLGLLRTGLYLRATLGLEPAPAEADIDSAVTAAVRTFLRAFGA